MKHEYMGCADLTTVLQVGDKILYDSTGEARNSIELNRASGATVVAVGVVKAVYPYYVIVELPKGVRETANRGTIIRVLTD